MVSHWSLLVLIGPYSFLKILMRPSRSLSILIGPDLFLWVLRCSYEFLCVLMGIYVFLWVLIDLDGSLFVLISYKSYKYSL